jgi:hypothetical protein
MSHVIQPAGDAQAAALGHHADDANVQPALGVDRRARRGLVVEREPCITW